MIGASKKMQPPEHDHLKMLADWYGWIIFGLVTIFIAIAKTIGKLSSKAQVEPVYATQDSMKECQARLMEEFKGMRNDVNTKIDHAHAELLRDVTEVKGDIKGAHKRIDVLYRRD